MSAQDGELTRCALFAAGLNGRVRNGWRVVTCRDCLDEGPAAVYVTLPDGHVIERRSAALAGYPFAVAIEGKTCWRLRYWADSADEARFLAGHARGQVLPVQFAEVAPLTAERKHQP